VLDTRAASHLLASARAALDLLPVAHAAGCAGAALPLDAQGLERLGIAELTSVAHVASGAGSLRALLIDLAPHVEAAPALAAIAARLTRRAPEQLWLLLVCGQQLAIAAWNGDRARPRVAALRIEAPRVLQSDAETVTELAAAGGADDVLVHARWMEILGRDALTARFYRALEGVVAAMAEEPPSRVPPDERRSLALLHVSRLLFLSFLETRGWLDADPRFLARAFDARGSGTCAFQRRVLHPLFFGTLNTPASRRAPTARAFGRIPFLNGGLFARTALERRHPVLFTDGAYGALFDSVLLRYRFTPREARPSFGESAVDPEMLGRAFESLMFPERRRATGTFYTPQALVAQLVDRGLSVALRGPGIRQAAITRALQGQVPDGDATALRHRLTTLTVLDPACGSGAFLVYALERVAGMLALVGDTRSSGALRRAVLARSIFGVDVDPTAVWLCELRLWLSVVVEHDRDDAASIPPLPNLDRQIRVGDSLAGELPREAWRQPGGVGVARLRERYARASGARKRAAAAALDRAERSRALARIAREYDSARASRRELAAALRGADLFGARAARSPDELARLAALRTRMRELRAERRRLRDGGALPFAWGVHTADVLDAGGFDLVVANPPWVRLHRIPTRERASLRSRFEVFGRAGWSRGTELARAGRGFAAQVDLAALFVERGLSLVRAGGALAYLLPSKLWRSLAGGGVRRLLAQRAAVELVEDWSAGAAVFDAAVYPCGLVARALSPDERTPDSRTLEIAEHRGGVRRSWRAAANLLPAFPADHAAPWLLLPPEPRAAFERLQLRGLPLAQSAFGPPMLGVKTGCNDAFCLRRVAERGVLTEVAAGDRRGVVETALLRPLLRGEAIGAAVPDEHEMMIWTHDDSGAPPRRLPHHAALWLAPHERRLRARTDLHPGMPWWTLFRTASASTARARVVWADVARSPRVLVLERGDPTVALNSCYVLSCTTSDDARALAALLRSPPCAAWLHALAEPARGGYLRHLAWTVALLPIPADWPAARHALLSLTSESTPRDQITVAAQAYGIDLEDILPLVEWSAR
jgi:hypothetical protein